MRFAIVGAGAIGCALAARLSAAGAQVTLLARGAERLAALEANGIACEEAGGLILGRPQITAHLHDRDFDVIFLAVKGGDLSDAVATTGHADRHGPLVVPLVNGIPWWFRLGGADADRPIRAVDPEGHLLSRFDPEQIVGAVVYTNAMLTEATSVRVIHNQRLIVGPPAGSPSTRLKNLVAVMCHAGIDTVLSPHIRDEVWTKVALNLATNPLSVVTEAMLGEMCSDPRLLPTVHAVLDEVWRLAARYDARPHATRSEMIARGCAAGAFRTSMLDDFGRSRPIELASIADAVLELAGEIGLEMPVSHTVAELARYRAQARVDTRK